MDIVHSLIFFFIFYLNNWIFFFNFIISYNFCYILWVNFLVVYSWEFKVLIKFQNWIIDQFDWVRFKKTLCEGLSRCFIWIAMVNHSRVARTCRCKCKKVEYTARGNSTRKKTHLWKWPQKPRALSRQC